MFRHVYVFSIVMCYLFRTHSLVADETEGLHALILILRYSRDVIVIVARRGVKVRSHPKVVRYGLSLYITYFHICTTAVMDNRPNSVEILSHGWCIAYHIIKRLRKCKFLFPRKKKQLCCTYMYVCKLCTCTMYVNYMCISVVTIMTISGYSEWCLVSAFFL